MSQLLSDQLEFEEQQEHHRRLMDANRAKQPREVWMPLEGEDRVTSPELRGRINQYAENYTEYTTFLAQHASTLGTFNADVQGYLRANHKETDPKQPRNKAEGEAAHFSPGR